MHELDWEIIKADAKSWRKFIPLTQLIVFVMCGGGAIGRFAAENPADFYIDARVPVLPYSKQEILQVVMFLKIVAETNGLDAHNMRMPDFHAMGVF